MNVTVVSPSAAGFLTVFPTGTALPNASNLNFAAGQTVPNLVVARLGGGGQVDVMLSAGTADLLLDVVGWFGSAATPLPGSRHRDPGTGPQAGHPRPEPGPGLREGRPGPDDRRAGGAGQPGHHRRGGEPHRHGHHRPHLRHGLPGGCAVAERLEPEPGGRPDPPEPGDARRVTPGADQAVQRGRQRGPDRRPHGHLHRRAPWTRCRRAAWWPSTARCASSTPARPSPLVGPGTRRHAVPPLSTGGVAGTVAGLVMNVTATRATAGTFLTVYPPPDVPGHVEPEPRCPGRTCRTWR